MVQNWINPTYMEQTWQKANSPTDFALGEAETVAKIQFV
jgi:hypothetical protein